MPASKSKNRKTKLASVKPPKKATARKPTPKVSTQKVNHKKPVAIMRKQETLSVKALPKKTPAVASLGASPAKAVPIEAAATALPQNYKIRILEVNGTMVRLTSHRYESGFRAVADLLEKETILAQAKSLSREDAERQALEAAEVKLSPTLAQ